jgi:hypothetical protein
MLTKRSAHYAPEEIAVLRQAVDQAWASLSVREQGHISKSEVAEHILKLAAAGERDVDQLCHFALQRSRERSVWLELAS